MEHSNFIPSLQTLKRIEIFELRTALQAYDGRHTFNPDNGFPVVCVYMPKMAYSFVMEIYQISLCEDNRILAQGSTLDQKEITVDVNDIITGHLHYILKRIPAHNGINDVSVR